MRLLRAVLGPCWEVLKKQSRAKFVRHGFSDVFLSAIQY